MHKSNNSALAGEPQTWSLGDRLLFGSLVALAFLLGIAQIADTDVWWHLRTGELIWERGQIPQTDWFTYTNPESPWIDLHWGFQLLLAGLWRVGGAPAVVLATATVGGLTFALIGMIGGRQWPVWQTVICLLPSLLVYAGRYHPRPEMLTQLLLVVTLVILYRLRERPRTVWLLIPVQLVWVNVHSLFILGWVAWGAFLADALARRVLGGGFRGAGDPADSAADYRRWGLASIGMLAADLMNPYGVTGLLFPLTIFTRISSERDFYVQHAGEFQSMGDFLAMNGWGSLFSLSPLMLLVMLVLGLSSFALLAWRGRYPMDRLLLFAAFGYLAWQANRNAAMFAVVGGLVIRLNLGEAWELARAAAAMQGTRRQQKSAHSDAAPSVGLGRAVVALLMAVLLISVPLEIFSLFRPIALRPFRIRLFALDEVPHWHPHEAAKFLARQGMPPRAYGMHLGQAAVYLYHNGPERRVFADPRLEVNTRDTLQRVLDIVPQLLAHDSRAEENLLTNVEADAQGRRELPALMFDLETSIHIYPRMKDHPRWRMVFLDGAGSVYLSREKADALGLKELDLTIEP